MNKFVRISANDLLYYAGCAEKGSEHPLAKAIVQKATSMKYVKPLKEPLEFKADPGRGICATVDKFEVLIGNRQYMEEKEAKSRHNQIRLKIACKSWNQQAKQAF